MQINREELEKMGISTSDGIPNEAEIDKIETAKWKKEQIEQIESVTESEWESNIKTDAESFPEWREGLKKQIQAITSLSEWKIELKEKNQERFNNSAKIAREALNKVSFSSDPIVQDKLHSLMRDISKLESPQIEPAPKPSYSFGQIVRRVIYEFFLLLTPAIPCTFVWFLGTSSAGNNSEQYLIFPTNLSFHIAVVIIYIIMYFLFRWITSGPGQRTHLTLGEAAGAFALGVGASIVEGKIKGPRKQLIGRPTGISYRGKDGEDERRRKLR